MCFQNQAILCMWDYEVSCPSTDWRIWTLASSSVHLVILLVVLLLVSCGWWPSWHHRRVESLNLETRSEICRVVNENWDQLLKIAKDLVDARLEDGEKYCVASLAAKASIFYDYKIHTYNISTLSNQAFSSPQNCKQLKNQPSSFNLFPLDATVLWEQCNAIRYVRLLLQC